VQFLEFGWGDVIIFTVWAFIIVIPNKLLNFPKRFLFDESSHLLTRVVGLECQHFFVPRSLVFASARSRCNFSNLAGAM